MTDRELMQQVLEALEGWNHVLEPKPDAELISALRSRLAQPEQEPVAHTLNCICGAVWDIKADGVEEMVHAPNPPQRKPLTDEEIEDIWADCSVDWDDTINVLTLARAIEAAHGIKGEA